VSVATSPDDITRRVREQWANGDQHGAYVLAVVSTQDSLYRFLVYLLRDEEDAREVFQDTYVRVFQGLGGFRGDAALTTWVLRIGRNLAWNRRRRDKVRRARELSLEETELDPPASKDPKPVAYARELHAALDRLPDTQREAVLLYYLEELSVGDVAAATGRPVNTVKSDLLRARTKLREYLAGSPGPVAANTLPSLQDTNTLPSLQESEP
jgi:RNA polymerase sigma-70 factor, ECF subfamily